MPATTEGLFDKPAAAAYLGVSIRTLFDLSSPRGPIPVIKPTQWLVRYQKIDLDDFIAARRQETSELEVA